MKRRRCTTRRRRSTTSCAGSVIGRPSSPFGGRAYFPWSPPYQQGFFSALLWFVPIVAFCAIVFKRNQRPITLYFLIATIVSVPIVVGYYHDALGDAVTTPIYDAFYRYFPGFQMFRFSYKWVAGVEFGI